MLQFHVFKLPYHRIVIRLNITVVPQLTGGQEPSESSQYLLKIIIILAVQAYQHTLNTCIVLQCVPLLELSMLH